jgi:acylaminoacyl-peptidase
MNNRALVLVAVTVVLIMLGTGQADSSDVEKLQLLDVFELEYAADPQIAPDGQSVVYARAFMDIMSDRRRSNLWIVSTDGSDHRPLTSGNESHHSPRWSPDGERLLYVSGEDDSSQIYCRWLDSGQTAKLTRLQSPPRDIVWSPDGKQIAFSMLVPQRTKPFVEMPPRPAGAEWAPPPIVIQKLQYRADGAGYLKDGFFHLFILPAEGGTPRQITSGDYHHRGPRWAPDGQSLIFSANRRPDWAHQPRNSEIFEITVTTGEITALTDRIGPDSGPAISPDGKKIAYLGYDDHLQGYQVTCLYLMNRDGSLQRMVAGDLDRDVENLSWSRDGSGLFFQYDEHGSTKVGFMTLDGTVETLADKVGGLSLGRPYSAGTYSVAEDGSFAFTQSLPDYPADLAVARRGAPTRRLTRLNQDLLGHKQMTDARSRAGSPNHLDSIRRPSTP